MNTFWKHELLIGYIKRVSHLQRNICLPWKGRPSVKQNMFSWWFILITNNSEYNLRHLHNMSKRNFEKYVLVEYWLKEIRLSFVSEC